jgi:H+-transporting ATPase
MSEHHDVENGNAEKETLQVPIANEGDSLDEYDSLVRYISTYRDGRRQSVVGTIDDDVEEKGSRLWYAPWKRASASGAGGVFEVPDDWINTDIKQGLTGGDVEKRRRKTGWNELTSEKENMFIKFLSFFTGPILYGEFYYYRVVTMS